MVTPEDIRRKAANLYPAFLQAWLEGIPFFPRSIPSNKALSNDIPAASKAVQALRANSKEALGFGYSVEWKEVRSRAHGQNAFPHRIFYESEPDFLRAIGKTREFQTFAAAVTRLRSEFPELSDWCRRHSSEAVEVAPHLDGLIEVLHYLRQRPRPQVFPRELPLSVDTKFVERHQRILRSWLDLVLPPQTIRADEEQFERRFGLRYVEPHLFVRFLDGKLREQCGVPCDALSIPVGTLAQWKFGQVTAVIVENKTNLLTLPTIPRGVALGGLGYGAVLFRDLAWLLDTTLLYWGDIDVQGFGILSEVRALFPHAQSIMMDKATLESHRALAVSGTSCSGSTPTPSLLTEPERMAFSLCLSECLRVEQERIPQPFVLAAFAPFGG